MAGAFDLPEKLRPEFHIFTEHKLSWIKLDDDLPCYRQTPSLGELMT